jgi:hypothetical protein
LLRGEWLPPWLQATLLYPRQFPLPGFTPSNL